MSVFRSVTSSVFVLPMLATVTPIRRAFASGCQMGARYTKAVTDQFHLSSSGDKGERAIHFRERATSTAS